MVNGPPNHVLDEPLLRAVAKRLGKLSHIETVSVFPREKPESVVATLDEQYFSSSHQTATLELRAYTDGAFYITYREDWEDRTWMCRWDRHENPHNQRDHFHRPPRAGTADAVDADYPTDLFVVLDTVLDDIDERLGAVWDM